MSIQKLRGNRYEPQRSYMWEVEFKGPLVLSSSENLTTLARSVTIPQKSVETISIPFQGERKNFAGMDSSEKTFTVNFLETERSEVIEQFRKWMFLVRNDLMRGSVDRLLYIATIDVKLKNSKDDKVTSQYRFEESYPISMGEVVLDYSSNDPVSIPITFAYMRRQEQVNP